MSLSDDAQVERALRYLASTDEESANAWALVRGLEHQGKVIRSMQFLDAEGPVAEREARALSSMAYQQWVEKYQASVADAELLRAKRKRAELTVDVWRTRQANSRKGNI